jgi:hypothetical protein
MNIFDSHELHTDRLPGARRLAILEARNFAWWAADDFETVNHPLPDWSVVARADGYRLQTRGLEASAARLLPEYIRYKGPLNPTLTAEQL